LNNETYYTIGEVSKICNISSSTLRYYDKIGLIKANMLSFSNEYRYYTYKDIAKIRIIQNLKDLNFSLNEIAKIISNNDLSYQLFIMKKRRDEIYNEIQILQNTFHSIDNRINNIENEMEIMNSNVADSLSIELKQVPKRKFISIRRQAQFIGLNEFTLYFNELIEIARKNNIIPSGNFTLIYHHINLNNKYDELDLKNTIKDIQICLPVDTAFNVPSLVSYLPEGLYLSAVTKGMAGKDKFQKIYFYIQSWLKNNNYSPIGPMMDVLLSDIASFHPDSIIDNIISEIQIPIGTKSYVASNAIS